MILKAVTLLTAAALSFAGFNSVPKHKNPRPCKPHNCPTTTTSTTGTTTTQPTTTTTTITQPTTTTQPPPPPDCTAVLNPSTSDTLDTQINDASKGNVICLHGGNYSNSGAETFLTRSGTSSSPLIVKSYPGERATINGALPIGSSYLTLQNLDINQYNTVGNQPSCPSLPGEALQLAGSNITLDHNNIFQSPRGTAYNIYISGSNEVISHNKIHDAGGCQGYDHGIYVGHGSGTHIFQNWIYTVTSGWCVQIYPDSSNVNVNSNVCDGDGSGVVLCSSGSGNVFQNNVVSNSVGNNSGGVGSGSLQSGCIQDSPKDINNDQWNNPGGLGECPKLGTNCSGNLSIDPQYVDRTNHNYTVLNPSLAGYGLWDGS